MGAGSAKVSFMQRWLRLLSVWLIAFALPVQGMAGVTMAHCAPSHERMQTAARAMAHQHAHHGAGPAHHHDCDSARGADVPDDAEAAQGPGKSDKMSDPTQHKCSSCASCCAGPALPSAMLRIPQVAAAPAVFAEGVISVEAIASDGPDRPPRRPLV